MKKHQGRYGDIQYDRTSYIQLFQIKNSQFIQLNLFFFSNSLLVFSGQKILFATADRYMVFLFG